MRVLIDEAAWPPGMAGAWRTNAHAALLPAQLDSAQLVSAVFSKNVESLVEGETLHTQAGRFEVESVSDSPRFSQVVLLTHAPSLAARFGMTAETSEDGCSVVLYTSVHPHSGVGRLYYRLIEPFHHILVEQLLLRRLRKRAQQFETRCWPIR